MARLGEIAEPEKKRN